MIQGLDGAFRQEAKRMGQLYSRAYWVPAASRSPGYYAGFQRTREETITVSLQRTKDTAPLFICEAADDFGHHVLEGPLSQRG